MAMVCINYHDWSALEEYMLRRAKEKGVPYYSYSEPFDIEYKFDPEIEAAYSSMSFNLGLSLSKLFAATK